MNLLHRFRTFAALSELFPKSRNYTYKMLGLVTERHGSEPYRPRRVFSWNYLRGAGLGLQLHTERSHDNGDFGGWENPCWGVLAGMVVGRGFWPRFATICDRCERGKMDGTLIYRCLFPIDDAGTWQTAQGQCTDLRVLVKKLNLYCKSVPKQSKSKSKSEKKSPQAAVPSSTDICNQ